MAKNLFENMENYNVISRVRPDVYQFINLTALVGKNEGKNVYRINRSIQQLQAFGPVRDRMLMGFMSIYAFIFERLHDKDMHDGNMRPFFLIGVESANDTVNKILSYDGYLIQANSYAELITNPKVISLQNANNPNRHVGIFNFGLQYVHDLNSIGVIDKVFHIKSYKEPLPPIKGYDLDTLDLPETKNVIFDVDSEACQHFIHLAMLHSDDNVYHVGLDGPHDVNFDKLIAERKAEIDRAHDLNPNNPTWEQLTSVEYLVNNLRQSKVDIPETTNVNTSASVPTPSIKASKTEIVEPIKQESDVEEGMATEPEVTKTPEVKALDDLETMDLSELDNGSMEVIAIDDK